MSKRRLPEEIREKIKLKEIKNNPLGAFGDSSKKTTYGNFFDLTGSLGTKIASLLLLVLISQ